MTSVERLKSYLSSLLSIFSSIILALICIVLVSSIIILLMDIPDYRAMSAIGVPTMIAVIGFALYGIQGTLWWWVAQISLKRWQPQLGYQNLISATLSSLLSCVTLPVVMQDFDNQALLNSISMMLAVCPVAIIAVWIHYGIFVRSRKNK